MGRPGSGPLGNPNYNRDKKREYAADPVKAARNRELARVWQHNNNEHYRIRHRAVYYRRVAREYESCVYIAYSPSDPTWIKVGQTCQPSLRLRALKNTPRPCRIPHDSMFYYKQKVEKENRVPLEKQIKKFMRENYVAKSKDPRNEIFYVSEETEDMERIKMVLQDMAMAHHD